MLTAVFPVSFCGTYGLWTGSKCISWLNSLRLRCSLSSYKRASDLRRQLRSAPWEHTTEPVMQSAQRWEEVALKAALIKGDLPEYLLTALPKIPRILSTTDALGRVLTSATVSPCWKEESQTQTTNSLFEENCFACLMEAFNLNEK